MRSMGGLPVTKVPHHNSFNPDFIERWRREKELPDGNPNDFYNTSVGIAIANEEFFPSRNELLKDEDETQIVNDGWGQTVRIGKGGNAYFAEHLDTVLKDASDVDKIEFESPFLESRYVDLNRQVEAAKRGNKCLFAKIGGIYCRCHFLRGEVQLLMDMALDEDFCEALFDRAADHFLNIALETLRRTGTYETGLWIFDDMAGTHTPLFSAAMYEKYFLPRYQRIINTVKDAGCKRVIFHSDGNILPVFEQLIAAGFDGFNPLEPRCGMDVVKLREKYGKIYFGGICNTEILSRGDREEIKNHVMPVLEAAREGGIIPGFASASSDISTEAYEYYYSLIQRFNGWQ